MKQQLHQHVDWLDNGLDRIPLERSETFIWIFADLNLNLSAYGMNSDLDILKVMFLLAQTLRMLLYPPRMSIAEQVDVIQTFSEEEVRNGCIDLRAYDLSFNSQPRKLVFCVSYDLLYYYEYDIVKLYILLRDDVNDMHYFAA